MNLLAIFHIPKSHYCYGYNEDTIHIRLRTAKGDATKVQLIYGDKYNWENRRKREMVWAGEDRLYDYFSVEIQPPYYRLAYYFSIENEKECVYYTERGFLKEPPEKDLQYYFFQYPYLNKGDVHKVPQWVKDAVFYSIFPDRFYSSQPNKNLRNMKKWGEKPSCHDFYGGDLQGIIDKLDYLENLGITAIYLTPVFESPTNHKYDTTDYFKIDPSFGDTETLRNLVKECHCRGIKVILDAVFNHSGYFFKPFQDVLEKGKDSPYFNWFHIHKWSRESHPPEYQTFAFVPQMPKLNTQNPEVKEYLLKVTRYWIETANIDGWRLDVADEIDHTFWREFRKSVKSCKEDAYIVGEVWHDASPWLMGDQFDAVMNYAFMKNCIDYFAEESLTDQEFKESINAMLMQYTKQVNEVMYNLLDSHDTPRFLTRLGGNIKKLMLASVFQFTFVGVPSIYYGTEIGMEGGEDPDCRRTMEWNEDKWNPILFNHYKKLIQLRKTWKALRRGSFRWLKEIEIPAYVREFHGEKIFVFLNNHPHKKRVFLKGRGEGQYLKDLLSEEIFHDNELDISPYTARIVIISEK